MKKVLFLFLVFLVLVAIGAPFAYADDVTFNVSGSLSASTDVTNPCSGVGCNAMCNGSGCTLGGTIEIDNITGAIIGVDVTVSGESPLVGPFTVAFAGVRRTQTGLTEVPLGDPALAFDELDLVFATPTAGSLVGYDGGPLSTLTNVIDDIATNDAWNLTAGALTPVVEPSSLALMLAGIGFLLLMRKRSWRTMRTDTFFG